MTELEQAVQPERKYDFLEAEIFPIGYETTYLVLPRNDNQAPLLVDPTKRNFNQIASRLQNLKSKQPINIWITHPHLDHFDGAMDVKSQFPSQIICHRKIAELQKEIAGLTYFELLNKFPSNNILAGLMIAKNAVELKKLKIDQAIDDGENGFFPYKVVSAYGHSICDTFLVGNDFVFSGDIWFVKNNLLYGGRINLPGSGSEDDFWDEEQILLACAKDKTKIEQERLTYFPGHDHPFTWNELGKAIGEIEE